MVVWNPLSHKRSDVVTVRLDGPVARVRVLDSSGAEVPAVVEDDGWSVSWRATDVGSLGWRSYRLVDGAGSSWEACDGVEIANATMRVRVDPARGGAVVSLRCGGREVLAAGRVGNELAVYDEYPAHPEAGEGPWHLLPSGPVVCSSAYPASVQAYRSAVGQRLVVSGAIGDLLRYTQTLTLWSGADRLDCRIAVDDFTGADKLLRLRWPCPVPGALPVSEVGDAVIGRGFGLLHDHDHDRAVDTAHHPWTLDNPAHGWFGLSSCVRIRVGECTRAMSVAEVISPSGALLPWMWVGWVVLRRGGVGQMERTGSPVGSKAPTPRTKELARARHHVTQPRPDVAEDHGPRRGDRRGGDGLGAPAAADDVLSAL